jgi:GNAT superfamily N-acetyltransferase
LRQKSFGYNRHMKLDPVVSLRVVNNQRLMRATHRGEYRDLGGALAITSDAPEPEWNCIEGFTTDARRIDGLLDVGFSLLRAFDRVPAARITPLDRPAGITSQLQRRGMRESSRYTSMCFAGDTNVPPPNSDVTVRQARPDDAASFATIEAQATSAPKWGRAFLLGAALANVIDAAHRLYIAHLGGEPVGVALTVMDGATAGVYSVATIKSQRRKGVAAALLARAVQDARSAGADLVCAECPSGSDALRLFERAGFALAHESALWTAPE